MQLWGFALLLDSVAGRGLSLHPFLLATQNPTGNHHGLNCTLPQTLPLSYHTNEQAPFEKIPLHDIKSDLIFVRVDTSTVPLPTTSHIGVSTLCLAYRLLITIVHQSFVFRGEALEKSVRAKSRFNIAIHVNIANGKSKAQHSLCLDAVCVVSKPYPVVCELHGSPMHVLRSSQFIYRESRYLGIDERQCHLIDDLIRSTYLWSEGRT